MGTHIDVRSRKTKVKEHDEAARRRRATFKQYLRQVEEELLEDDLNADEDEIQEQEEETDQDE